MTLKDSTQKVSEFREMVESVLHRENFDEMYEGAMMLIGAGDGAIPEGAEEEILPLVEACCVWRGYDPRMTGDIVMDHADWGESDPEVDAKYHGMIQYREKIALMLLGLKRIFPDDLYMHLQMNQSALEQLLSRLKVPNLETSNRTMLNMVGRDFLNMYRSRR